MKISVCFKVVPDYDKVPKKDWERPERLEWEYVRNIFGVFDEGALEGALRLKDELTSYGQECTLEAVTYGHPDDIFVSTLYAVGYDRVVEIHGQNYDFSPESTANALASYFCNAAPESVDYAQGKVNGGQDSCPARSDIIIFGKMVGPGDTGTVPYFFAEKTGLPLLNKVTALKAEGTHLANADGHIAESATALQTDVLICRRGEQGKERYIYGSPVIVVMEDAEHPHLRLYTLMSMMDSQGKKPEVIEYKEKTQNKRGYKIAVPERKKGKCEFIEPGQGGVFECLVKIINETRKSESIETERNTRKAGTREIYSGYLELRERTSRLRRSMTAEAIADNGFLTSWVRGRRDAGELPTADEIWRRLICRQQMYTVPDYIESVPVSADTLSEADVVVAIGRGAGSRAEYQRLKEAFEEAGAAVGCTRLAAMSGYEDYSRVIGISGKTLKAKLCICIGISGAGPFCRGLEGVRKVVAVNSDAEALIWDRADVGILCDIREKGI